MARQKSEATIERERDREIRRQRRALIKEERDRKRAIRAEKTRLRELVRNGDFVETATVTRAINIFDLTRGDVHHWCRRCRRIKRSSDMKTRDLCEECFYTLDLEGGAIGEASIMSGEGRQSGGRESKENAGLMSRRGRGLAERADTEGEGKNPQHSSPSVGPLNGRNEMRPNPAGRSGQKTLPLFRLVGGAESVNG